MREKGEICYHRGVFIGRVSRCDVGIYRIQKIYLQYAADTG